MAMPKLTIESSALASLVLTLMLVVVIVWMNYAGWLKNTTNSEQIARVNEIEDVIHQLREHMLEVESGERGYIITGNENFLEHYQHGLGKVEMQRTELMRLVSGQSSEQGRMAELDKRLNAKVALSQANVLARKQSFSEAQARVLSGAGKREMDALVSILEDLSTAQNDRKLALHYQRMVVFDEMRNNIALAAVLSVVVLIYLHLSLMRMMKLMHESEQNLQHIASHDVLTGLPNRRLMIEHIDQAMQRCKRHKKSMALLFLDLNGFKPVNDQYGHKAGDEVLKQVAQRLSEAMRASDRVARFGGDEFVVLVEDIQEKEDVCGIVAKVDEAIFRAFTLVEGIQVSISTSIGVAIYPRDAEDMESLLRVADTAMYAAKNSASNCFCKEQKQLRRCVLT
jgi:diguanylate cyclase (GGDEF)-like protein